MMDMREAIDSEDDHRAERYQEFVLWFLRTLGLVFLFAGLFYWLPIIGLVDDPADAFLNLDRPDQVATVILAVLMPVAATGLWFGASWGVGLIAMSLIFRLVMGFGFPQHFALDWIVICGHIGIILIYIGLRLLIHRYR